MSQTTKYEFKADVADAVSKLKELSSELSSLSSFSSEAKTSFSSIGSSVTKGVNKISQSIKSVTSSVKNATKSFNLLSSASGTLRTAFKLVTGIAIGKWFSEATKEGINYLETLNYLKVATGDAYEETEKFIDKMSEMYGINPRNLMEYEATFRTMGEAVSMPTEAVDKLSNGLTVLTVDLASLRDVDVETVFNNMASGMRGMSRSVLKYGMDIRASTIEAYANSEGITQQYETMNEASREILRYIVMVKQATGAMGDFANTIESPANQLRILKEQIQQFGNALSKFFITPLANALPYINGFVMAMRTLLEMIASFMNFKYDFSSLGLGSASSDAEDTSDAVEGIGDSATDTAKKMKNLLAPFDELNVLSEDTSSSTGADTSIGIGEVDPAILALLDQVDSSLTEVRMKALDVRDAILEFLGISYDEDTGSWIFAPDVLEEHLSQKFPGMSKTIHELFNVDWSSALQQAKNILSTLSEIAQLTFKNVVSDLLGLLGIQDPDDTISKWVHDLNTNLDDFSTWLDDHKETIAEAATRIVEAFLLFQALSFLGGLLTTISTAFTLVGGAIDGIGGLVELLVGAFSLIPQALSLVGAPLETLTTDLALNAAGSQEVVSILGTLTELLGGSVFSAFGVVAGAVVLVVTAVLGFIDALTTLWTTSDTFRENFSTIASNIFNLFQQIFEFVSNVFSVIMALLDPFIQAFSAVFQGLLPVVQTIINAIVGFFTGLFQIINGILEGDGKAVFKGFAKVILSLAEAVTNIAVGIVNGIISVIFAVINAVGSMVYSAIKAVITAVNLVSSLLGKTFDYPSKSLFVFETVPTVKMPAFDYTFAEGGVVTGPTRALIGEAGRSEAVIPLDNSPQMEELVQQIADAVKDNKDNEQPLEVHVYLDGREITSSQNRTNRMFGKTQQNV